MFGTQEETDAYRQQDRADQEAKRIREAFRTIFDSPDGQIVLDYLVQTFCDCPKLVPGFADATAENLGMEKVVREIKRLASHEAVQVESTYHREEE